MWIKINCVSNLRNATAFIIDRSFINKRPTTGVILNRILAQRNDFSKQVRLSSKSSLDQKQQLQNETISTNEKKETKTLNEDDWFKKILKPAEIQQGSWDTGPMLTKRFGELTPDEKREYILSYYEACKERGETVPKKITDEYLKLLMRTESLIHFKKTLIYLCKQDYYNEMRESKRKMVEERRKEKSERGIQPGEIVTNYPGHFTFINRLDQSYVRRSAKFRVLTSILNDEPSVVFDFRFVSQHTRIERVKSLYRQIIELVGDNRCAERPFQIHFCNYDYQAEFHTLYGDRIGLDTNLIMETPNSYLDVFDRKKLVYLSGDASKPMTHYDPDKVYIIGAMIDMSPNEFKFHSYGQAKKDGIECRHLPLSLYKNWNMTRKALNLDTVFKILLKLKHGATWNQSFQGVLPGSTSPRFQTERNTRDGHRNNPSFRKL